MCACVHVPYAGQILTQDCDVEEDIPTSIEIGLLGLLRKLLTLLPDSLVSRVVGPIVHHEALLAIANSPNSVVRTGVVMVRGVP